MTDDITQVAAKIIFANGYDEEYSERHYMTARAVLRAVKPLIRAEALEEAAQLFEDGMIHPYAAIAIRALKEQL